MTPCTSSLDRCERKACGRPAIEAAIETTNRTQCDPPLGDDEIRKLINHVLTQHDRVDFEPASPITIIHDAEPADAAAETNTATDDPAGVVVNLATVQPEAVQDWLWPSWLLYGEGRLARRGSRPRQVDAHRRPRGPGDKRVALAQRGRLGRSWAGALPVCRGWPRGYGAAPARRRRRRSRGVTRDGRPDPVRIRLVNLAADLRVLQAGRRAVAAGGDAHHPISGVFRATPTATRTPSPGRSRAARWRWSTRRTRCSCG